jgi:hypothetical protein
MPAYLFLHSLFRQKFQILVCSGIILFLLVQHTVSVIIINVLLIFLYCIPYIYELFAFWGNTLILWNLRKNWSLKIKTRKFKATKLSIFGANLVGSAWYNGFEENQRKITVV